MHCIVVLEWVDWIWVWCCFVYVICVCVCVSVCVSACAWNWCMLCMHFLVDTPSVLWFCDLSLCFFRFEVLLLLPLSSLLGSVFWLLCFSVDLSTLSLSLWQFSVHVSLLFSFSAVSGCVVCACYSLFGVRRSVWLFGWLWCVLKL